MNRLCMMGLSAFGLINCVVAQDIIVKKDGTAIQAKVMKVGTSEVEYKKWSNQEGPTYAIAISDILAINYINGEKETFEHVPINDKINSAEVFVNGGDDMPKEEIPIVNSDNLMLVDLYTNQKVNLVQPKYKEKPAKRMYSIWGVTSNSVLSDSRVTVCISKLMTNLGKDREITKYSYISGYAVQVKNKTDENIYIDLANSFKINDFGNSKPYYSNRTYTVNKSSGSGVGVNMGAVAGALGVGGAIGKLANGVNVGGGSTSGTSVTETEERILVVPPHSIATLPLEKKIENKSISEIPERFIAHKIPAFMDLNLHEFKDLYTEQNTPSVYRRIITYSTTPDFKTYTKLNFSLYLKGVLGEYQSGGCVNSNPVVMESTHWDYLIITDWIYQK